MDHLQKLRGAMVWQGWDRPGGTVEVDETTYLHSQDDRGLA